MRTQIIYSELYKQVLGMVVIPLLYCGVFIALLTLTDQLNLSETVINILIYAGSFLLIGVSVYTVLKLIMVDAELQYDTKGFHIFLNKRSFLFPHKEFFISYSNIENAAISQDRAGRTFATVKIKSPSRSLVLSPGKDNNITKFEACWDGLEQQFNSFNASHSDQPGMLIKSKGFYESKWIKFTAWATFFLAIFFTALKIYDPSSVSTWRLVAFYCYAIPFISIVVQSNSKKKIHK